MMSRLMPLAAILIAIGIFFGYVKPTWQNDIATVKGEIVTYDKALAAATEFFKKVDRLNQEKNEIPEALQLRLQNFLPDGVDNIQLILDLTELAERSGIELTNFDTPEQTEGSASGEIASTAAVESLTMSVDAKGTYDSFRAFLDGVERSLRPLDVRQVSIGNSDTGVYEYQITMEFYWLR